MSEIVHATTVATNAILERRGARTALVTTDGFRDVLELRRIRIPFSYDLGWEKPAPLVERYLRFEVRERIDRDGAVLTPLDDEEVAAVIDRIAAEEGVESIAVCLLHAYRNPAHERAVGEALRARRPGTNLSLSHEVLPEIKEFERTSTTVVNAYVAPLIGRYLERLRESLHAQDVAAPILVMQSNGGLVPARTAVRQPVTIIESGPAAGVVAAAELARRAGHPNVITLDMGGTTTKASIIEGGEMLRATEYEVGSPVSVSSRLVRGSGYLLRIPVIDISEVGAGGGSIAAMDVGGAVRVGPRSAGADPGPACYGRGNTDPTVTDANLVLGYLHPTSLAGGALRIDRSLAERAVNGALAGRSGSLGPPMPPTGCTSSPTRTWWRAIKSVSVERGRDPAHFILIGLRRRRSASRLRGGPLARDRHGARAPGTGTLQRVRPPCAPRSSTTPCGPCSPVPPRWSRRRCSGSSTRCGTTSWPAPARRGSTHPMSRARPRSISATPGNPRRSRSESTHPASTKTCCARRNGASRRSTSAPTAIGERSRRSSS